MKAIEGNIDSVGESEERISTEISDGIDSGLNRVGDGKVLGMVGALDGIDEVLDGTFAFMTTETIRPALSGHLDGLLREHVFPGEFFGGRIELAGLSGQDFEKRQGRTCWIGRSEALRIGDGLVDCIRTSLALILGGGFFQQLASIKDAAPIGIECSSTVAAASSRILTKELRSLR